MVHSVVTELFHRPERLDADALDEPVIGRIAGGGFGRLAPCHPERLSAHEVDRVNRGRTVADSAVVADLRDFTVDHAVQFKVTVLENRVGFRITNAAIEVDGLHRSLEVLERLRPVEADKVFPALITCAKRAEAWDVRRPDTATCHHLQQGSRSGGERVVRGVDGGRAGRKRSVVVGFSVAEQDAVLVGGCPCVLLGRGGFREKHFLGVAGVIRIRTRSLNH